MTELEVYLSILSPSLFLYLFIVLIIPTILLFVIVSRINRETTKSRKRMLLASLGIIFFLMLTAVSRTFDFHTFLINYLLAATAVWYFEGISSD